MLIKIIRYIKRNDGFYASFLELLKKFKLFGFKNTTYRILGAKAQQNLDYQYWIDHVERKYIKGDIQKEIDNFTLKPKISFLIPIYNVEEIYLRACVDSIRLQYYENWELCLADDCSTAGHIKPILQEYANRDHRIKVVFRSENGHISEATNSALEMATGEYIALVDNDDMIKPEALYEIVKLMNQHPDADMIYSDEDKIDSTGVERSAPAFKPDWSPDLFFCQMYLCHLGVYRRHIVQKIGGFRTAFNGSQDYDFVLRFIEHTRHIYHIPKILYHWRMIPTSTAMGSENKNYAFDASFRAKQEMMDRQNIHGHIVPYEWKNSTRSVFEMTPQDYASILVVSDEADVIQACIQNIYEMTADSQFEILVGTSETTVMKLQCLVTKYSNLRLVIRKESSIPSIYKQLITYAEGNCIICLNPQIKIMTSEWVHRMVGQATQGHTGLVSGLIMKPNHYIDQAGLILCNHNRQLMKAFENYHCTDRESFDRLQFNSNYLVLSELVFAVEKQKILEIDGFNTETPFWNIDLCMNLYDAGYFNVYRGDLTFYLLKQLDLSDATTVEQRKFLQDKCCTLGIEEDPFYNQNLNQQRGNFTIKLTSD